VVELLLCKFRALGLNSSPIPPNKKEIGPRRGMKLSNLQENRELKLIILR
jgi:hypothetical protein